MNLSNLFKRKSKNTNKQDDAYKNDVFDRNNPTERPTHRIVAVDDQDLEQSIPVTFTNIDVATKPPARRTTRKSSYSIEIIRISNTDWSWAMHTTNGIFVCGSDQYSRRHSCVEGAQRFINGMKDRNVKIIDSRRRKK